MSIRNKLFLACESFLRVPPLLVVDEIFRYSFGFGGKIIEYGASSIISQTAIISSKTNNFSISSDLNLVVDDVSNVSSSSYYSNSISDNFLTENDINYAVSQTGEVNSTSGSASNVSLSGSDNLSSSHIGNLLSHLSSFKDFWEELLKLGTSLTPVESKVSEAAEEAIIGEETSSYLFQVNLGDLSIGDAVTGDLIKGAEVVGCLALFAAAVVMFMLSTENLIKLYSYLISFLTLYLAYITTPIPNTWTLDTLQYFLLNIVFRTVLAGVFFLTRSWPGGSTNSEDRSFVFVMLDAVLLGTFYVCGVVLIPPVLYVLLMIILQTSLWMCVPTVYKFLKKSWNETKRVQNEYGLSHLIQVESGRLRINTVFRLFWMSRAAYDGFYRCCDEPISHIFRYVMTHGTETFTGIIGLTVTVSAICHQIGEFLLWILYYGTNSEADANRFGSISTVLFFILSLQTGLTSLDPQKRLDRLMKNIVLLGTALFHALHQMVAPLLHAFRTFQALQFRAVAVSITFLCVSIFSTFYLVRTSIISTWSLAVLALAIEFKIKIVISLVISLVVYLSQLVQYPDTLQKIGQFFRLITPNVIGRCFDRWYDTVSHEDAVFYLKSFANIAEFLTGIFLFANAIWIFLFESASAIRAIGMSIHAYFNIWCEAQKGWKIYCQRKTASQKILSLADATTEQLESRQDDVCAICYEEMESAKVTNCGHLFHAVCLRKWLYVQNTCPLCHEVLYGEDALEEDEYQHAEDQPQNAPQNVEAQEQAVQRNAIEQNQPDLVNVPEAARAQAVPQRVRFTLNANNVVGSSNRSLRARSYRRTLAQNQSSPELHNGIQFSEIRNQDNSEEEDSSDVGSAEASDYDYVDDTSSSDEYQADPDNGGLVVLL